MITTWLLMLAIVGPPQDAKPAPLADYLLGPQDVLSIVVVGEPDLTGDRTVDNDGTIDLLWIGRVKVGGLTARAAQDLIEKRLIEGNFLTRAQVTVQVKEYRSQSVYVSGEVAQPGEYPLTGNTTILDLVNRARLLPTAGDSIEIRRSRSGNTGAAAPAPGETEVTKVSKADLQSGRVGQTVSLRDGDTIYVPKAAFIFVSGQVRTPNAYTYDGELNVMQALTLAGGMTERAAKNRIKILRPQPDGTTKEINNVKMTDIVKPGDTIVVPQRRI